jgi:hypothetical protein
MTRRGLTLLLFVLAALAIGFFAGMRVQARAHPHVAPGTDTALVFEPFILPPTPIPGLHEYAVPLRPAPTATPTPPTARLTVVPAAGHTSSGSGSRTISSTHGMLGGLATWYATGRDGLYAAAGPALRAALGKGWRGQQVLVVYQGRGVAVTLSDWCLCRPRHGFSTLIDLSDEAFAYLAPLSRGVIRIAVDPR